VVTASGQPISGALLAISGNKELRMVTADANGRFDGGRFKDGEYTIEIGKSGYLTPEFRGPSSNGRRALSTSTPTHAFTISTSCSLEVAGSLVR
jgi:hypothetical protein